MKHKITFLILLMLLSAPAFALDMKGIAPVNPLDDNHGVSKSVVIPSFELKKATLTKNAVKNQYTIAMDKFTKSNVRSSYADFKVLIDSVTPNDYVYMRLSQDMASVGFFNLAELAMAKIQDESLSSQFEQDVKNFYFPAGNLTKKDQIYLAELYSNMRYNDQSREATSELSKQTALLNDSDYANYVAAFGAMKSGDYKQAKKYIDTATQKNPTNINYRRLKAEIIAQSDNPKDAISVFNSINSDDFRTVVFDTEIDSSRQYILYKSIKNDYLKKYHLAHYYYDNGEYNKAIGVLQTSISGKKSINKDVYALYAFVYYDMKEFEKAQNYAQKALDIDKSNPQSLLVLGNIAYRDKDYQTAIKYYKKIQGKFKDFSGELALAQTYLSLKDISKAKDVYSKILRVSSKSFMAYYQMALLEPDREFEYLKKAISVNPDFKDAWIDLARVTLKKENIDKALSYLRVAKYIDDSDYRYYYYLGLILKDKGMPLQAKENFEHSLKLNPNYDLPKKELNI